MTYSAVIFDLNGTVLDDEKAYGEAFSDVLKKHGAKNVSNFPQVLGIGLELNMVCFKKQYGILEDVNMLVHEVQDAYHSRFSEIEVRPGFFELHGALKNEGKLIALATSNDWWIVEDILDDLKLHECFDAIVTREEVAEAKPSSDLFLLAARKLGVENYNECIVFEDSQAGIQAAKSADMLVIGVLDGFTKREELKKADLIIDGFEEVSLNVLEVLYRERMGKV